MALSLTLDPGSTLPTLRTWKGSDGARSRSCPSSPPLGFLCGQGCLPHWESTETFIWGVGRDPPPPPFSCRSFSLQGLEGAGEALTCSQVMPAAGIFGFCSCVGVCGGSLPIPRVQAKACGALLPSQEVRSRHR